MASGFSSAHQQLLAGATSGLISCLLLQPFDVLKTRLQEESLKSVGAFNRSIHVLSNTVNVDGVKGLWRGTVPTILRNVPGTAGYFFALSRLKNFLLKSDSSILIPLVTHQNDNRVLSNTGNLLAGGISRAGIGFLMMPFSSQQYKYNGVLNAAASIFSKEGVKGLFAGFGATALRDAPFAGLYVLFYEKSKLILKDLSNEEIYRVPGHMVSGILAGFSATLITQPFDMIKTRIQLHPIQYGSTIRALGIILKQDNVMGLFAGMGPRLMRKTLSSAITWTVYEELINRQNKQNLKKFIAVGQNLGALEILYDNLVIKRYRTYNIGLDSIMSKFIDLCVLLEKGKMAKEGLTQFKNLCQNVNIQSLEVVVKKFMEIAEAKIKSAHSKLQKVSLDQIEDLEATESPERLLSASVGDAGFVEKTDRDNVAAAFRFLWETYRTVLDVLRNNSKLEILYQATCVHAFEFCVEYSRSNEFRRLCEVLRSHLISIQKYNQQPLSINLNSSESFQIQLEVRFHQLNAAVKLQLWQEAFRSIEDIHGLLSLSKRSIRPTLLANYFEKLAIVFHVGENHLFHAASLNKLFSLLRSHPSVFQEAKLKEIARTALLSALVIPIVDPASVISTLESYEVKEKMSKLSSLIGISSIPSRQTLVKDGLCKSILPFLDSRFVELYNNIEVEFHPLSICQKVGPMLEYLHSNEVCRKYVVPLYNVTLTRFVQQISQVYSTLELSKFADMANLPKMDEFSNFSLEMFLLNGTRAGLFNVRIDHKSKTLSFLPLSSIECGLTEFVELLTQMEDKKCKDQANIDKLKAKIQVENQEILGRKAIIEEKKEKLEKYLMEKEKEEAKERAIRHSQEQEAERLRLLEESKKRELERMKRDMEEIGRQEAKKLAETIKKEMEASGKKIEIDNLENLDKQELLTRQMEQIDRERKEMEVRLKSVGKRIDHLERAYRKEELPLLQEDYEMQKKEDKKDFEAMKDNEIILAKAKKEAKLKLKSKLASMKSEVELFKSKLLKERIEKFEQEKQAKLSELQAEKAKRIAQFKKKWEEDQRILNEKEQERILKQEAEEERHKAVEAQKKDEEEKQRKLDRIAEIQREKDRLIAEKLASNRNNIKDEPAKPKPFLAPKEGGWRSRQKS